MVLEADIGAVPDERFEELGRDLVALHHGCEVQCGLLGLLIQFVDDGGGRVPKELLDFLD
jgi:hypothetical protein